MKKVIATLILSSLLTSSAFASSQNIAEIMANYKDQLGTISPSEAATQAAKAIVENNISKEDLNAYLKEELSPASYAKISAAVKNGTANHEEIQKVVAGIGHGAQFLSGSCYDYKNTLIMFVGGMTAFLMLMEYDTYSAEITKEENAQRAYVDGQNSYILATQQEISALRNEGVYATSYLVTSRQDKIDAAKLNISQSQSASDKKLGELKNSKTISFVTGAVAGAVAGRVALRCF